MTDLEFLAMEKSTIVRSRKMPRSLPLLAGAHRGYSALAPAAAARRAERLFLTPPRPRRPAAEIPLLAIARARPVRLGSRRMEMWAWGSGPPVLLVHGWGGRGAQLGAFVSPLVAHGFSVVTFDGPGHGASDAGQVTIPELVSAIRAVAGEHGPLSGLVAHSGGAVASARALHEGLETGAAVFVGPLARLFGAAVDFTERLGFSRDVGARMRQRIEARVGAPWSAFDVAALAPALNVPLLVVHDHDDAEVPWQDGALIARAWPGAEFLMTDGLGHRRILKSPDVIAAAVAFIAARTAERRETPRPDGDIVDSLPALAY